MSPAASPVVIDGALPSAIDPLALSLNENPFPPLPAVRSALIRLVVCGGRHRGCLLASR
jgi:histidinol-phosphate aminotransferase